MAKSTEQVNHSLRVPNDIHNSRAELLWDEAARPLKIVMTIFGLYNEKETWKIHPESEYKDKVLFFLLPKIYHFSVVLFLWYNFLRAIVSFWIISTPDFIYDNVSICAWGFLVAANDTIFLKICYRRDILQLIANQSRLCFLRLEMSNKEGLKKSHIKPSWMKYRSFALAGTVVGLCTICINTAAMLYMIYGTSESSASYRMFCLPWYSNLACGVSSVFAVYGSASWVFAMVFVAFTCRILAGQLTQLTHDFTETFEGVKNFEAKLLNSFRQNFSILCRSTELADKMLSPLIAVSYCANIPVIIFLLYQMWYRFHDSEPYYVLITSFWILGNFVNIGVISYWAVTVHEKAHSLRRHVHDLQTETFDPEIAQIQMLFLARLDGPEIGMTALGCFVITKERVLAVISTLITYFTILLQFKGLCPEDQNTMATANSSMTTESYTT